jgi:hypothetical protein
MLYEDILAAIDLLDHPTMREIADFIGNVDDHSIYREMFDLEKANMIDMRAVVRRKLDGGVVAILGYYRK